MFYLILKNPDEYLVSEGLSFAEAKKQAQSEILNVFHMNKEDVVSSELMNIAMEGDDNAILLAVSSILQGYRTEAELSELISYMLADLSENGELNNEDLGSQLINHARYLRADQIRENLEQRHAAIGDSVVIPEFEHYIQEFIDNTSFEITEGLIKYPPLGIHGVNILDPERSDYVMPENGYVSLAAELKEGTSLRVRISRISGSPGPHGHGMWMYVVAPDGPINWSVKPYDQSKHKQEFIAIESGRSSDLKIRFLPGRFLIEYFEMHPNAEEPIFTSEFTVSD
ncbi:MAG: hypothetical protein WD267_05605 [Balneolales bacterium]